MAANENEHMGKRLKALRNGRNWTQGQLAIKIGVSRELISKLESAKKFNPGYEVLDGLAKALGVTREILMGQEEHDVNIDDFIMYLHGKNPSAKELEQLRQLAEVIFKRDN